MENQTQTQTPNLSTLIDADRVLLPLVNPIVQAVTGWPRSLMSEFQDRIDAVWADFRERDAQISMFLEPLNGFKISIDAHTEAPGYVRLWIDAVQPNNDAPSAD